jgi:chorismate lyase/3-hydroxybenzoate synthase
MSSYETSAMAGNIHMPYDQCARHRTFQVAYEPASSSPLAADVLACIQFGQGLVSSSDPRRVFVNLAELGTEPVVETWRSRQPVEYDWSDGFGYAHNGDILFAHLHLSEEEIVHLARATMRAYQRIDQLLSRLGYPCLLRIWNFLAKINEGAGDAERYRQFCRGRNRALAMKPGFERRLPAATAIGTRGEGLTIYFLAARDAGTQVENPRQISAFHYPRAYGPRSPSFSRATLKAWSDGAQLFVSGTASVVGHESLHRGDHLLQLDETFRNFRSLLKQAEAMNASGKPLRAEMLKLYTRDGSQLPEMLSRIRRTFDAEVPMLCLEGDICRRDLLVEIEGLYDSAQRDRPALRHAEMALPMP